MHFTISLFMTLLLFALAGPFNLNAGETPSGATASYLPEKRYSDTTRYTFEINGLKAQIPYASNRDISLKAPKVERLIVAIHSSSYDPDFYVDIIQKIAQEVHLLQEKLLIISPAFYRYDKTSLKDIVLWQTDPFWGNSRALYLGKEQTLSAFEILDDMIEHILSSGNFPNLKQIVIFGHSAGGQFVNRYAASNTFMDRHRIPVKFLVMAPSSYVYFSDKRAYDKSREHFRTPETDDLSYDHWGYGLKKLYSFHRRHNVTAQKMTQRYPGLKIRYLVGSEDVQQSSTLDKNKEAMLQGLNRKERAVTYYNHLKNHFGNNIKQSQDFYIIESVGHSAQGLISSERGREFILFDR